MARRQIIEGRYLMRPEDVVRMAGCGFSFYYDVLRRDPAFPPVIEIGPRAVGHWSDLVEAYFEARAQRRVSEAA